MKIFELLVDDDRAETGSGSGPGLSLVGMIDRKVVKIAMRTLFERNTYIYRRLTVEFTTIDRFAAVYRFGISCISRLAPLSFTPVCSGPCPGSFTPKYSRSGCVCSDDLAELAQVSDLRLTDMLHRFCIRLFLLWKAQSWCFAR